MTCPEVEKVRKLSSKPILCFHVKEPAGAGWILLFFKPGSLRWCHGQPTTKHLRVGQLVRPQSGIHLWLVKWLLIGISAGEDLFLVILTWRWDNRGGQPCYMLYGIPNMVFILKNGRKPSGKKNKRAFPQGGPFLMHRQTREIFHLAQKRTEQSETGPGLFSSQDKSHCPVVLGASPSSLVSTPVQPEGSEPPPLFPGGIPSVCIDYRLTPPWTSSPWGI